MRNSILLISTLMLIPFYSFSETPVFKTAEDVRIYFDKEVENFKKKKGEKEKIEALTNIKNFIYPEIDTRSKTLVKMYSKSIELNNSLLEEKNPTVEEQHKYLKDQIQKELLIVESLNNYEVAFKNLFTVFIYKNGGELLNCETLNSSIESLFLSTAPEGSALPNHAIVAVEVAKNICISNIKKD